MMHGLMDTRIYKYEHTLYIYTRYLLARALVYTHTHMLTIYMCVSATCYTHTSMIRVRRHRILHARLNLARTHLTWQPC